MKQPDTTPQKSAEKTGQELDSTLDLMKALEGAAIVMEAPPPPTQPAEPPPSYNPYDTGAGKTGRKR